MFSVGSGRYQATVKNKDKAMMIRSILKNDVVLLVFRDGISLFLSLILLKKIYFLFILKLNISLILF